MAQLISLRSIDVQNVRYERVLSRDALRTPREALLCHIEPQGACKLTTDQSLTGNESMGHGFPSLLTRHQRRNLQCQEIPGGV